MRSFLLDLDRLDESVVYDTASDEKQPGGGRRPGQRERRHDRESSPREGIEPGGNGVEEWDQWMTTFNCALTCWQVPWNGRLSS
mmetsp:Transcript_14432/g.26777  ORF Transcript_14432/g.26777 Transcript_14432/m.26777 type:complete len:84 (+) Transcript_14432:201-452(+)